jgi:membrane protein DedA with SNARE-associated domain
MLERYVELIAGRGLHAGFIAVFVVLLLCGFGLPMPEDLILVSGGVLAWLARGRPLHSFGAMFRDVGLLTMIGVGLAGIIFGDSIIFMAGRRFGHRVADFRPLRRIITPAKLERVEKELRKRGNVLVLVARFLPGLRAPTFFVVGHARLPYWEFLLFDGAAALVSAPLWVCLGFWFGSDIQKAARHARQFSHYILIGAVAAVVIGVMRWRRQRARERAAVPRPAAE